MLSICLTGVLLGLAEAIQVQTSVTHQGGATCPVQCGSSDHFSLVCCSSKLMRRPDDWHHRHKNSLSSRCQALLRCNPSTKHLIRTVVGSIDSVDYSKVVKCI